MGFIRNLLNKNGRKGMTGQSQAPQMKRSRGRRRNQHNQLSHPQFGSFQPNANYQQFHLANPREYAERNFPFNSPGSFYNQVPMHFENSYQENDFYKSSMYNQTPEFSGFMQPNYYENEQFERPIADSYNSNQSFPGNAFYNQSPMNPYGQQAMSPNLYGNQSMPVNPYGQAMSPNLYGNQSMPVNLFDQQAMSPNLYGNQPMPVNPYDQTTSPYPQNNGFDPQNQSMIARPPNPYDHQFMPTNPPNSYSHQPVLDTPFSNPSQNTFPPTKLFGNPLMQNQPLSQFSNQQSNPNPFQQLQQNQAPYQMNNSFQQKPSGIGNILTQFKSQNGSLDFNKMVGTTSQMVSAVNQVYGLVKGIGGIFKVGGL